MPVSPLRSLVAAVALILVAGLAVPAAAQDAGGDEIFPFPVHQTTLDNGLQVVVVPYDSPGIVAYYTVVRTGSRQEVEPGHSGFAHFFEHMMFRGTDKYSPDAYNDALKAIGADSNASTSDDWTIYYIVGPSAQLEKMADLESDRFINLKYTEDAFRTEALAVLGEYNKNASNPFRALYEEIRGQAFDAHTYEHTTMGFVDDIKAMPESYDYSLGFFDRFYRPENVIVLVVGDVDPERTFDLARKYYGGWEKGYQAADIEVEPPQTEARESVVDWPNPTRPHLMMAWHVPGFDDSSSDTAALDLLSQLLFSENAPLYQDLVVDRQLVDFINGGADFHRDPYLFMVTTRLRSADDLDEVEATVERALKELQEKPVAAERLDRIKAHMRYGAAMAFDSAPAVAEGVAQFLSLTGDPDSINRLYAQYSKVTPADVQRVAREYFDAKNRTVVRLVHPEPKSDAPAGEAAQAGASEGEAQ